MSKSAYIPHQLTQHTKLLQKVAIIHEGKVLLLKRSPQAKSRPEAWDLPGGNSEWPVDLKQNKANLHQQDAAREVLEETGLKVRKENFTSDKLLLIKTFFEADKQIYTVILGWLVTELTDLNPKNIIISDEHTGYAWVNLEELADYDFGDPAGEFVMAIAKRALQQTTKVNH